MKGFDGIGGRKSDNTLNAYLVTAKDVKVEYDDDVGNRCEETVDMDGVWLTDTAQQAKYRASMAWDVPYIDVRYRKVGRVTYTKNGLYFVNDDEPCVCGSVLFVWDEDRSYDAHCAICDE